MSYEVRPLVCSILSQSNYYCITFVKLFTPSKPFLHPLFIMGIIEENILNLAIGTGNIKVKKKRITPVF